MHATGNSIRVLHVDDEPGFAEMASSFLEREDERFEVETARSAGEGLDRLAEDGFDCVVSDYDMPGQTGIEFLEILRESNLDLPFILFTGKGSEEIASDAISAGVTDYLQKEQGTDQYAVLANRIANAVEKWRAEREAEQTRTRLEAITGNSTDAILTIDAESTIRFANRAVEDLFGYAPEDLVGESLTTLMSPQHAAEHRDAVARYLETGERTLDWSDVEFPGRHRDGHEIPLSISFGEFEQDGQQRFVGVIRDVSHREESRRRLETLIDNLPGIVYRCRNEPDWPMEYVRGECETLTGYEAGALERDEVVWGEDVIHPDDRDATWEAVQDALDRQEPFEVTYRIVTRDGAQKWMWERGRGVYTPEGELEALEGFITDVTERKEREQDLQRYKRMVNTMQMAACIYDADGRFEVVNEYLAAFYGTTRDDLVGQASNLIPKIRAEAAGDPYQELLDGERAEIDGEIEGEFPGAGHEVLSYRLAPLFIDGDIEGAVGVAHEVTERRQRERELRAKNERLDEFASVVGHDLRNPLNVASGHLSFAMEECDSEHLPPVENAHDRMDALIDDLLTLAREGEEVGDLAAVDLGDLAERCWQNVETADATLVTAFDGAIRADEGRLQQLLENLIGNAVEHGSTSPPSQAPEDAVEHGSTSPDSQARQDAVEHGDADVTVTVGATDDGFYVADDGPGIPEDEREDVFDAGYSTSSDGTGFGLRIVEQVATAHGWTVDVTESEAGGARIEVSGVERAE